MNEEDLLIIIAEQIGLSLKNNISIKNNKACVLTAVSLTDIQAVINFMFDQNRARLQGLKRVKFLL